MTRFIDIVFDGPPSAQAGRFVEVEDSAGKSINFGEWVQRPDGYWVLRFPDPRPAPVAIGKTLRELVDERQTKELMERFPGMSLEDICNGIAGR